MYYLISKLKREIFWVILFSGIVSTSEIYFLLNLRVIFEKLTLSSSSHFIPILFMCAAYGCILVANLTIVYFVRYLAFMKALKISCDIITNETLRGRLFDEPSLNSMLAVEKERLAREIIYPY